MSNFNERQVRMFWDIMRNGNDLTEIRLISNDGRTGSGYFTDVDTMIAAVKPYVNEYSVYYIFNILNPDVYGRPQRDKIVFRPKNTTVETDVQARSAVFIDIDSKRTAGVNATEEQLSKAKKKANEVYKFLKDNGFYAPIVVLSGSGVHLYLRCALLANEENDKLVKRFTLALNMLFSDEDAEIDPVIHNRARLARCIGFYNRKGSNADKERPQRLCEFVKIPEEYKVNPKEYFEKIAALYPEDVKPSRENNYSTERFNLDAFIEKHNIKVTKIESVSGGKKYVLECCPFNHSHRGKDAVLFQRDTGEIAFHCFHSSDADKNWRSFRTLYEPDAYTRKRDNISYNRYKPQPKEVVPIQQEDEKGKLWLKMSDIKRPKLDVADYIPTGVEQIDKLIIGFKRKHCSLWSGYRGSAKSSVLNMFILNAAQQGYKTALWTGELDGSEVKQWLYLQASGKAHNRKSQFNDFYYTPDHIAQKIDEWIDKYIWLFNNEYGENAKQLELEIRKLKKEEDIDMVILDSLMVLDYEDFDGDRNEKQKNLMRMLTKLAKELNIHIHIVAHPNKSGQFLRANNISGSGHIPDLAQNIFIIHRMGLDFSKNAQDFLSSQTINDITDSGATNVIEIVKCRDKGSATDKFIKLFFEIESNRLKNSIAEHIVYNWEEQPVQGELTQPITMPSDPVGEFAIEESYEIEDSEECPF